MNHRINIDPKTIGARFRSARSLVSHLNRKSFCERHDINRYTMQSWENGLHVSKGKNVTKFINALAKEGIYCTAEWLFEGIGDPARPFNEVTKGAKDTFKHHRNIKNPLEKWALELINQKKRMGIDLIKCHIKDDAMAPKFIKGDIIIGKKAIIRPQLYKQKSFIVKINDGQLVARKVIPHGNDQYLLIALDEQTPSFTLGIETELYEIVCHFPYP